MTTAVDTPRPEVNNYFRKLQAKAARFAGKSVDEIFEEADLNFEVEKVALYTEWGDPTPGWATRRTDTEQVLGIVGRDYQVRQNAEIKPLVESFLEHGSAINVTAAGTFKQGSRVYLEAEVGRPEPVAVGDNVGCRVRFDSSHDGSSKHRFVLTPLRLTCQNGMVVAGNAQAVVARRHTRSSAAAVQAFEEFMAQVRGQFDAAMTQYRLLTRKPITSGELREYVGEVFKLPEVEERTTRQAKLLDQIIANHDRDRDTFRMVMEQYEEPVTVNPGANVLDDILRNFEAGAGSEIPSTRGSYWNAYNAVSEYVTHQRGNNADRRLESLWYGSSHQLNQRALELALGEV